MSLEASTWLCRATILSALGFPPLVGCGGSDEASSAPGTGGTPGAEGAAFTCKVDQDCPAGERCRDNPARPLCQHVRFLACTTPTDECGKQTGCPDGYSCVRTEYRYTCEPPCVAPGRPFLVDGAPRVALVTPRRDWCSSLVPDTAALTRAERAALAAHWTEVALMEHASIAAFARFALELMSLGAPASLIAETRAAMADETEHARDAFALASAYSGERIGPGAFDAATSSLSGRTMEDIVHTTILEGCIGETVAAVEAAEALSGATDPAVREALTRVAADEARHAALAWRFVQWAMTEGTAELRGVAQSALESVVEAENGCEAGAASSPPGRAAHGMLDDVARAEIRRRVLTEVVAPCAAALRHSWRSESSSSLVVV